MYVESDLRDRLEVPYPEVRVGDQELTVTLFEPDGPVAPGDTGPVFPTGSLGTLCSSHSSISHNTHGPVIPVFPQDPQGQLLHYCLWSH